MSRALRRASPLARHRLLPKGGLLLAAAAALGALGCDEPDPPPGGAICGAGQVAGTNYLVDSAELVIAVFKEDAFGCGALHSHVVEARQATFTFDLDASAGGEVEIVVPVVGLEPDDPDLRRKYLPAADSDPLSDGDRNAIRGSVVEEVIGDRFPALEFTLRELSTLQGSGTAKLVSKIAGLNSTTDVTYEATADGDNVVITGSAGLDGEPHGMPRNALGFCVKKDMEFSFTITLAPGTAVCDGEVEEIPPFVPTLFPDEECGEVGYNVVRNEVVGPRCMGCHGGIFPGTADTLRGGATVPLIDWEDFRIDSLRNAGEPLYLTAHKYVELDPNDGLAMPPAALPPEATELLALPAPITIGGQTYNTERALWDAWVNVGQGRNAQCDDEVEPKTFGLDNGLRVEPGAGCGGLRYSTPNPSHQDRSAKDYFEGSCMYCHARDGLLQAPAAAPVGTDIGDFVYVTDFAAGEAPVTHPFYKDANGDLVSFWEASVHRVIDASMAPGAVREQAEDNDAFDAFRAWVEAGYCPDDPQ
jgi:hypothetical protein